MYLSALALGLASIAQPAPECKSLSVDAVSQLPEAERLEITACWMRVAAAEINAQQARRKDTRMTMRADVEGATLRYTYRLALDARQIPEARRAAMFGMLKDDLCASGQAKIVMSNGGAYRYVFKDRSGQVIRDVVVNRC